MQQNITPPDSSAQQPTERVRKPVLMTIVIALVLCASGLFFLKNRANKDAQAPVDAIPVEQTQSSPSTRAKLDEEPKAVETTGTRIETPSTPAPVTVPIVKRETPGTETATPRVEP